MPGAEFTVLIELAIGEFGAADAGRRGAHHTGDALGTVAFEQGCGAVAESVLPQGQFGELVIAALEAREIARQRDVFHAVDATDPGLEVAVRVIVGAQTAAALGQSRAHGVETGARGAGQGHGGNVEIVHSLSLRPRAARAISKGCASIGRAKGARNLRIRVFPTDIIMSVAHEIAPIAMSTVSNLNLRGALSDPPLRESLLVSGLMLLASGGLTFLASWGWVLYRAVRSNDRACVDWLVVCGHVLDAGRPSAVYRQRLRRAARLATEQPDARLLLAGGGEPSEAVVGRDWLVAELGFDVARVALEEISTDTFENLRHARGLLPPGARVGIVTSRFHLARVTVYARQLGLDAVPVAAEAQWRPGVGNLVATVREAAFLCWFVCGRFWARLAGRRRLLERIR